MTAALTLARAIKAVNEHGILLVYPVANAKEPPSLFSVAYPNVKMSWDWSNDADDRTVGLWHLRMRLAESRKVVYTKWFRGRATLFSLPVFRAMLAGLAEAGVTREGLSSDARDLLDLLEDDSPTSTKELRARAGLRGREHERRFQGALAELFMGLFIVGIGEVPDGAFPSLAVGATSLLFEREWSGRLARDLEDATTLHRVLVRTPAWNRAWQRSLPRTSMNLTRFPFQLP